MGIQGLLPLLKSVTTPNVHVRKCAICYCLCSSMSSTLYQRSCMLLKTSSVRCRWLHV